MNRPEFNTIDEKEVLLKKRHFTLAQASRYLKLSPHRLRKLVELGDIKGQKVGSTWRLDPDSVENWLDLKEMKSQVNNAAAAVRSKSIKPSKAKQILDSARLYLECMDIDQDQRRQQLQLAMLIDELAHALKHA